MDRLLSDSDPDRRALLAPVVVSSAQLVDWWEANSSPTPCWWWGAVYSWNPTQREIHAASVTHVVVELERDRGAGQDSDSLVAHALDEVEKWLTECADWAEVLVGIDTGEEPMPRTVGEPQRVENFVFELLDGSATALPSLDRQQVTIVYSEGCPISDSEWANIVERSNHRSPIPLAHLLLRDAHRARIAARS